MNIYKERREKNMKSKTGFRFTAASHLILKQKKHNICKQSKDSFSVLFLFLKQLTERHWAEHNTLLFSSNLSSCRQNNKRSSSWSSLKPVPTTWKEQQAAAPQGQRTTEFQRNQRPVSELQQILSHSCPRLAPPSPFLTITRLSEALHLFMVPPAGWTLCTQVSGYTLQTRRGMTRRNVLRPEAAKINHFYKNTSRLK